MDMNDEKISMASDFIKQCLLPELDREIGEQYLERDDFNVFVYGLNQNLRLLFDMIAKNEKLLLKSVEETRAFRVNFILLLNEQTSAWTAPFQTEDLSLLNHLNTLVDQYYVRVMADKSVLDKCLAFYKERLTAARWKRNIGALYGYGRFCELYYEKQEKKINADGIMFTLSVGMILTEYFEPQYKHFGIKFFRCLTTVGNAKILHELNIFEAIYEKLLRPLIVIIKEELAIVDLLDCLYKCARHDECWKNPSEWNKIDDILEEILKRTELESDRRIIGIFLTFIAKVTALPVENNSILQRALNTHLPWKEYEGLREFCKTNNNLLAYRWAKKLMKLFNNQELLGSSKETTLQLSAMHKCYLVCIYGIPMKLLTPEWEKFVDGIVPALINLSKTYELDGGFSDISDIFGFLLTLNSHSQLSKSQLDAIKDAGLNFMVESDRILPLILME